MAVLWLLLRLCGDAEDLRDIFTEDLSFFFFREVEVLDEIQLVFCGRVWCPGPVRAEHEFVDTNVANELGQEVIAEEI